MHITHEDTIRLLRNGEVVALPTETVYGLAASLEKHAAITQIFTLKQRPPQNPLIIHLSDINQISRYALQLPSEFEILANHFWPGPLTIVLPVHTGKIPDIVRSGLPTAAFRIPKHPLVRDIIEQVGPLVMPSANLSGKPSATRAQHVERDFGIDFPVYDGGMCSQGLESTIIYNSNGDWEIVRLGAIPPETFADLLGYIPKIVRKSENNPLCPGQSFKHYSPKARLHLSMQFDLNQKGILLGFSDRQYPSSFRVWKWGDSHSPEIVAENLYHLLRQLDEEQIEHAWVDVDFPNTGLWTTISERLHRAARII